jgi:putative N6-adenine-specific DNA methylase
MCGSGTFAIEAAALAADRAPGLNRSFAFERFVDFEQPLWEGLRAAAIARAHDNLPFTIEAADRHPGAIAIAKKSAMAAGVASMIRFRTGELRDLEPTTRPAVVFTNPPWGERLGEGEDLYQSWRALGHFLHERCHGAVAWILSGNEDLTRHLGLRTSRRIPVMNGPIECRFLRYEVFAQSGAGEAAEPDGTAAASSDEHLAPEPAAPAVAAPEAPADVATHGDAAAPPAA